MKYEWEDLPERMNCFTVRNATMINLNTKKPVRHYSANTKIVVVQKCVTPEKTYYRTESAAYNFLNYAFEAEAFGLPNENAPSVHYPTNDSLKKKCKTDGSISSPTRKTNRGTTIVLPKDGGARRPNNWLKMIFRRKNG